MKYLILILALALPGCSLFQPAQVPVSQNLSVAAQEVQKSINESNVLLTAAANVVANDLKEGILTKAQAQAYLDRVKDYARRTDQAQALLNSGNIFDAKSQAELLSALILSLHKEVVSRRTKT